MDKSCGEECPVDCIYEGDRPCTSTQMSVWIVVLAS